MHLQIHTHTSLVFCIGTLYPTTSKQIIDDILELSHMTCTLGRSMFISPGLFSSVDPLKRVSLKSIDLICGPTRPRSVYMWVCFREVNSLGSVLIPVLYTILLLHLFLVFFQFGFLRIVTDDVTRLDLIVMDVQLYYILHRESQIEHCSKTKSKLDLIKLLWWHIY